MIDEINKALEVYEQNWQSLISVRHERQFFASLLPTAVGWKVADRSAYDACLAELHDSADTIIQTWMNGRWIAILHLKDGMLANGVSIVKIMERRPNSVDALGLDHVDFYTATMQKAESVLNGEEALQWSRESNDVLTGYSWLSVWFDGSEAKLKDDTVLDTIQRELHELSQKIIDK